MDTLLLGKCIQHRTALTNLLGNDFQEYQRLAGLYLGGGLTVNEFLSGIRQVIERVTESDELRQSIRSAHNEYIGRLISLAANISPAVGVDDEPTALVETSAENYDTGSKLCCGTFILNSAQEMEILEAIHKKQKAVNNGPRPRGVNFDIQCETVQTCFDSGVVPNEQYLRARFKDYADMSGIKLDGLNSSDIWEGLERLLLKYCNEDKTTICAERKENIQRSNHAI